MSHIVPLGYIQFPTHRVLVSKDQDSDRIHCFKSTVSRCEIESFTTEDDAAEYIVLPMPSQTYQVVFPDENP